MKVEIAKIKPGKNFRRRFDFASVQASMEKVGQIEPIGVTDDFVLVYGECRLRAAKALGKTEIEAVFIDGDERKLIATGIFENMSRNGLFAGDETDAMAWLQAEWYGTGAIDRGGRPSKTSTTVGEVSRREKVADRIKRETGQSQSVFRLKARIGREGIAAVKDALNEGQITLKEASRIVGVPKEEQAELLEFITQGKRRRSSPENDDPTVAAARLQTKMITAAKNLSGALDEISVLGIYQDQDSKLTAKGALERVLGSFGRYWNAHKGEGQANEDGESVVFDVEAKAIAAC